MVRYFNYTTNFKLSRKNTEKYNFLKLKRRQFIPSTLTNRIVPAPIYPNKRLSKTFQKFKLDFPVNACHWRTQWITKKRINSDAWTHFMQNAKCVCSIILHCYFLHVQKRLILIRFFYKLKLSRLLLARATFTLMYADVK